MTLSVVSVIISGITAIFAILAPVIQSVIAQKGAIQRDAMNMLYASRLDAYTKLICASYDYQASPTKESLVHMFHCIDIAVLVASQSSQIHIFEFSETLSRQAFDSDSLEIREGYTMARYRAIAAMQSDLRQYQPKPHKARHAAKLSSQLESQILFQAANNRQNH